MGISKAFGKLNHQISGNKNSQRVMRNTIRNDSTLYKPPSLWQAFKIIVIMSTTRNLSLLAYQKKIIISILILKIFPNVFIGLI